MSVLEARLFGKICIIPDRGGPNEIVVEGEAGYLVNPKGLNCISEKMRVLLENHPLRHDRGAKARQRILKKFTLEGSTGNLLMEIEK